MSPQEPDRPIAAGPGHIPPAEDGHIDLTWSGSPWSLVGLSLLNLILTILTLGIYSFWGKTEVRRRIWSSIRLNDEPLAYTGTGGELLIGFVLVFAVVLLPTLAALTAAVIYFGPNSPVTATVQSGLYAVYFYLFGVAVYRARRYRLSRTLWRGIRGGMSGSAISYAWLSFWSALLIPFTLGWIIPWRANRLQARLTRETTFGNLPFSYYGRSGPLYARFAGLWIGGIVIYVGAIAAITGLLFPVIMAQAETSGRGLPPQIPPADIAIVIGIGFVALTLLAIIGAWYQSKQVNLFASYTGFDRAQLYARTTAFGLIGLFLTNLLVIFLSLGVLKPVAQARAARYFIQRIALQGNVDTAAIAQNQDALSRVGEGLAQAFDVDAF